MRDRMKKLLCCLLCALLLLGAAPMMTEPARAAGPGRGPLYGVKNVCVFLPFSGFARDNFADIASLGEMVAKYTGGELIIYKGTEATVDKLAKAMQTCAVVIIGSHGNNGHFTIKNGDGLTEADKKDNHVFKTTSGDWMIDGTVIVNHMTDAAPHSLVVLDSCMGMKNDLFCAPLLGRGVSVVFGYSETHTCYSASEKQTAFFQHLFQGETVGEAFGHMQQEAGLWDSIYMHYTLEQAMESGVAFPVIASEEDAYPGEGNVNKPQTVKSGWRLPVRTDILRKITVPYKEVLEPRVILANCKSAKIVGSGKLPEGLHYGVSGDGLLYLQGKATEKGYRPVAFETVSSNGFTMPVMTVGIMVADYGHATVLPTVEDTITAEDLGYGPSHEDCCMVNEPGYYLKILDFHSEPVSTYAIEKHTGALPYTLEFGTTEYSGTGYIKSAQIWSQAYYEGSYYATPPGRYDVTLDLITYPKGDVYRLPFRLTVNAARTITDYNVTTEFEKGFTYRRRLFDDLENYYVSQMEITGGSLPKGSRLLNGPDHDVEL